MRVYNRALSPTEVAYLYNSGAVLRREVSNNGLIAYYSFDEGRGYAAGDSSGNGNTGTFAGTTLPSWTPGKRGGALSFNGSTAKINLSNSASFSSLTSSFTVSHWIKTAYSTAQMYTVANAGSGNGWRFGLSGGKIAFLIGDASTFTENTCGSPSFNDGNWHLITGVYSRSGTNQFSCYGDGVFLANVSLPSAYPAMSTIAPGIAIPPCCQAFNGSLDDIRIYNRALSATEISKLFAQNETVINHSQDSRLTNGLVGYWSFNGSDLTTATATDVSGTGNNGTIIAATPVIGKVGQALNFNGSAYVDAGSSSTLKITGPITVSTWVKPTAACLAPTQGCGFIGNAQYGGSSGHGYHMGWYSGNNFSFNIEEPSGGGQVTAPTSQYFSAGNWAYVTGTFDGSNLYLYVNGVKVAGPTAATPTTGASFDLFIGKDPQGGWASPQFSGAIDEVRIYNRVLLPTEIQQLYLMGK